MKKILAILLVAVMMMGASALAEVKMGQSISGDSYAFCVATVAMEGDVIVAAYLNEFSYMSAETVVPVPNAEAYTNAEGRILGAKKLNNESYSKSMTEMGGATQDLLTSYIAIEQFVVGKTIADLEAVIEGKTPEEIVDAVTSCTLTSTPAYLAAIIEAAKSI